MLKIEVLFPEVCNLYGDMGNIRYLKECYTDATIIETALTEIPAFVSEEVDMIYMGSMTERVQEKVIKKLIPYKEALREHIDKGTLILFTGNAYEIMGQFIEDSGEKTECLGFFPYTIKRDMMHRSFNIILAEFEDMELVGFKNQFTVSYNNDDNEAFMKIVKGVGYHEGALYEGIRHNNFFATYLLGPLLVLNPLFTKYILKLIGVNEPKLAYEETIMEAYNKRLYEFQTKQVIK